MYSFGFTMILIKACRVSNIFFPNSLQACRPWYHKILLVFLFLCSACLIWPHLTSCYTTGEVPFPLIHLLGWTGEKKTDSQLASRNPCRQEWANSTRYAKDGVGNWHELTWVLNSIGNLFFFFFFLRWGLYAKATFSSVALMLLIICQGCIYVNSLVRWSNLWLSTVRC